MTKNTHVNQDKLLTGALDETVDGSCELERKFYTDTFPNLIAMRDYLIEKYDADHWQTRPVSVYYDTDNWQMRRKRASIRMRYSDDQRKHLQNKEYDDLELSIKTDGEIVENAIDRLELEFKTNDPALMKKRAPDFSIIDLDEEMNGRDKKLAKELLIGIRQDGLKKIFNTVVHRYAIQVPVAINGKTALIEVALDYCQFYSCRGSRLRDYFHEKLMDERYEIELELKPEKSSADLTKAEALQATKIIEADLFDVVPAQGKNGQQFLWDNFDSKAKVGYGLVARYMEECRIPLPVDGDKVEPANPHIYRNDKSFPSPKKIFEGKSANDSHNTKQRKRKRNAKGKLGPVNA